LDSVSGGRGREGETRIEKEKETRIEKEKEREGRGSWGERGVGKERKSVQITFTFLYFLSKHKVQVSSHLKVISLQPIQQ
jgi:hypothetical protein